MKNRRERVGLKKPDGEKLGGRKGRVCGVVIGGGCKGMSGKKGLYVGKPGGGKGGRG